eukprot:428229-Pelagomonas_calceolata.AAC.6
MYIGPIGEGQWGLIGWEGPDFSDPLFNLFWVAYISSDFWAQTVSTGTLFRAWTRRAGQRAWLKVTCSMVWTAGGEQAANRPKLQG